MKDENRDFRERWKEEKRRMFDSSEGKKAFQNVFDHKTSMALLDLKDQNKIEKMYGTIESGKESVVFIAEEPEGRKIIAKIYMNQAGSFRDMYNYLRGDNRFRSVKKDRRSVIKEWCKKEFKNLKKASKILNCPKPIGYKENILLMDFKGENFSPFPKIKDVKIENPEKGFERIFNDIKKLWNEEKLVHGDLSEYNILMDKKGQIYYIDFSQGVHRSHPQAEEFLKRDIKNVANFMNKNGAEIETRDKIEELIED